MAAGHLPNLRRLAAAGLRTEVRSTLPVATLPAWTSFLTAAEPAEHGVVDFFDRAPNGYALQPISGARRRLPTFLGRLSAAGLRVLSLGVPGTFPPEPVNGLLVAGFDAPGAAGARADAVHPPALYPELQRLGGWRYATFNEQGPAKQRLQRAAASLRDDIAAKEAVALALMARERWDLVFVHLQASDTALHHLWHTWDRASPRHAPELASTALVQIYARLDACIGRLVAAMPAAARILIVSDHGMMGASDRAVYLNRWLAQAGLLSFNAASQRPAARLAGWAGRRALAHLPRWGIGAAQRLLSAERQARLLATARAQGIDFAASQAFSDELDYAPSIWLNRRGRFPAGQLDELAAAALSERLRRALLDLRDPLDGAPLVARVHRRQDLPPGPAQPLLPDLLVEPAPVAGYRPSFLVSRGPGPAVTRLTADAFSAGRGGGLPGVHQRLGMLLAVGPGLAPQCLPVLEMAQAGALVYALLGQPLPADLSAQLPAHLRPFLPDTEPPAAAQAVAAPTGAHPGRLASPHASAGVFDESASLALSQRLRAMGYID